MKKMQNKPQATNTHKTILASIFAFIALSALYLLVTASMRGTIAPTRDTQEQATTSSQAQITDTTSKDGMKTFRSDFMKIEFEYPSHYELKENINLITLDSNSGNLEIDRQGVQYDSLISYVSYFVSKRSNISSSNLLNINGTDFADIVLNQDDGKKQRVLMTLKNYARYTISTNAFEINTDLESIAKSFKILD